MKNKLRILCLVFLAMLVNTRGNAENFYKPDELKGIIYTAYKENDFAALDKLGTKLRAEKSRTPSGRWNLSDFYMYLFGAMLEGRKENSAEQWSEVESKMNRWVASTPQSAIAPIALGSAQRRHAWALRGAGFANTVTQKGWEGFSKHLAIASDTLQINKKISSEDPQWYVEMLSLALAQSWTKEQYLALYEEAVSKEPLYYDTHVEAVERFLPMWGGDIEAIQSFAAKAMRRTAATEGQGLYAHIYWYARQRMGPKTFYVEPYRGSILSQMTAGFEDVIKKYPDDWNRNVYARFACEVGKVDLFISLARQFNGKPMKDAWSGDYFQKCKDWAVKARPLDPIP